MAKKQSKSKPLTKEQLAKFQPEDQVIKMQQVMGFDLSTAYNVGLELNSTNPAVVANQNSPVNKIANVDKLPEIKK